jgi:hypothetical protein
VHLEVTEAVDNGLLQLAAGQITPEELGRSIEEVAARVRDRS